MSSLMATSLSGSTPSPMKLTVESPWLSNPLNASRCATLTTPFACWMVSNSGEVAGRRKRYGSATPFTMYPGLTIWTWPSCQRIVASRMLWNIHSMNPPASRKAIIPIATVKTATSVRLGLRLRLRAARRKSIIRKLLIGTRAMLRGRMVGW